MINYTVQRLPPSSLILISLRFTLQQTRQKPCHPSTIQNPRAANGKSSKSQTKPKKLYHYNFLSKKSKPLFMFIVYKICISTDKYKYSMHVYYFLLHDEWELQAKVKSHSVAAVEPPVLHTTSPPLWCRELNLKSTIYSFIRKEKTS